jgi:FkbM family methyltransferase
MFWRTPGSWLYRRKTLSWLSDPSLVRQLPGPYRFFARYCALQGYRGLGAEFLLHRIIARERNRESIDDGIIPLRAENLTFYLDLQDPRFLCIPRELRDVQRVLRHFLQPGDSFLDLGANHGTFSIVASQLVGPLGFVIAVEPQPRKAALLRKLLATGPARFEVHEIACGDCSGQVQFYIPSATSGSAGLMPKYSARSQHSTVQVAMRPLDALIDGRRFSGRTVIKLDVEGSELAFLLGARQFIQANTPVLMMEVNPKAMRAAGTSKATLVQTLVDLGYDRLVTPRDLTSERPISETTLEWEIIALPASQ